MSPWIGYAIAGVITAPLVWWAKHSETGMIVLVCATLLVFAFATVVRIKTGVWPGDNPR